ncbi:MAG: tRNA (adenosine(37)-N6)-threonylcarbamoyltransferase complex ATPase subunit type 1 TsaE [Sulfitobacter sp.]
MATNTLSLPLTDADATADAAAALATHLDQGDVILLEGAVGAGKTHFARSLIRSLLRTPEDVPSPTFTLVQTYDSTKGEIWHADLYRLTNLQEVEELGLTEAFETAVCLIEWPDRLGDLAPQSALSLTLTSGIDDDARILAARWSDTKWESKLAEWRT